jgi:long-chain fatty acid transport protein
MKTHIHRMMKLVVATAICGSVLPLLATGYRLPDQDAFATGRGEAFVATADNPSAIYYNVAGISQLEGNNLRAGVYGIYLDPSFKSPSTGQTFDNQEKWHAAPQLFYTYGHSNCPVTVGIGSYSPYGLALQWPSGTGFQTLGTEAKIVTETINPVIAIKLAPNLSIGGGVMINYAHLDLEQQFPPAPGNGLFQFQGDGWSVGYNLGLLWKPQEKVSIGATFRSASTMQLNGHTSTTYPPAPYPSAYNSPANTSWTFPLNAVFGVSYRPTPKWNFEFDADYTDWNSTGTVNLRQGAPPVFLPNSYPITLDWQSSWYYEWGVTRYFDNGWHVSGGYIFNENSVPNAHYTPLVADMDRHFFSVGVGRKSKKFDWDVAYQFGYGPAHNVSGSAPSAAGQTADGEYKFFSLALAVSAGWHF